MDLMSYLTIIRQRWTLILAAVAVALGVTWMSLPSTPRQADQTVTWQATATLASNPANPTPMNMSTAALYATLGEVPVRAAKQLRWSGEPQVLAASVTAVADPETSTLTLSASGTDPDESAEKANVFAAELIAYFERSADREAQRRRNSVASTLRGYAERIEALDARIARQPSATNLVAERSGVQAQYETLVAEAASIEEQLAAGSPITILQPAVAIPQATGGFTPPSRPRDRLVIGAGLGLVLGLTLVLLIERLDSRLRTREQAEQVLQLPVLAEIPAGGRPRRGEHKILSATEPGSATAEAHRALRSTLLLLQGSPQPGEHGGSRDGTVILVTSARPGEGKTTTVANLAVVMAESGRKVLVLSLDFRCPTIQEFFDIPQGAGLSDVLFAGRPQDLDHIIRETAFPGVAIATGGQELEHPGALLSGVKPLITRARELADIVLIDSAPLLAVSDALDISPHVDAVLMVMRAKRTTAAQAKAAHRLLSRLHVPVLGVVLIGGQDAGALYGYSPGSARELRLEDSSGPPPAAWPGPAPAAAPAAAPAPGPGPAPGPTTPRLTDHTKEKRKDG